MKYYKATSFLVIMDHYKFGLSAYKTKIKGHTMSCTQPDSL